jgi:hypothetical protein
VPNVVLPHFFDAVDGLCGGCKALLNKMEQRGICLKRASFYMAYALYYEKHRRFESAEKMYRLGDIQR